jgi:hypothetical protein
MDSGESYLTNLSSTQLNKLTNSNNNHTLVVRKHIRKLQISHKRELSLDIIFGNVGKSRNRNDEMDFGIRAIIFQMRKEIAEDDRTQKRKLSSHNNRDKPW